MVTVPARDTTRSTSTTPSGSTAQGSGGGPAGRAPSATSRPMSATDRWERTVLIRVPAMDRWTMSQSIQKLTS